MPRPLWSIPTWRTFTPSLLKTTSPSGYNLIFPLLISVSCFPLSSNVWLPSRVTRTANTSVSSLLYMLSSPPTSLSVYTENALSPAPLKIASPPSPNKVLTTIILLPALLKMLSSPPPNTELTSNTFSPLRCKCTRHRLRCLPEVQRFCPRD